VNWFGGPFPGGCGQSILFITLLLHFASSLQTKQAEGTTGSSSGGRRQQQQQAAVTAAAAPPPALISTLAATAAVELGEIDRQLLLLPVGADVLLHGFMLLSPTAAAAAAALKLSLNLPCTTIHTGHCSRGNSSAAM